MTERFSSVLVANRGEIALRIIRTVQALGYRAIAVASEADVGAPHALAADSCMTIGPAPSARSYLDIDAIVRAAKITGAGAVHPGYGFLSENAAFAQRLSEEGIVFVGPSPEAISVMGDKAAAKRRMVEAGVPLLPGYEGDDQSLDLFFAAAERAGFPVMVKAAAGGGGRGMRRVERKDDLADAIDAARAEALSAFGSGQLILEKAIDRARHVEVQVIGDEHGDIIHLGERDCSLQRRHQKVIEESPSPAVSDSLRERMGEAAVAAARSVNYTGAGTVEFLLADDGSFYFLEMNTRLQVEHPVTEEVTGLDLVALQLRVAQGQALGLRQEDVRFCGHAIEARLYAEDPASGFLPSTGKVALWSPPTGVRVDAGIATGDTVSPHYDPMVAKIISRGGTRGEAHRALIRALETTSLLGPVNNRSFLLRLLKDRVFAQGEAFTDYIDREVSPELNAADIEHHALAAAVEFTLAVDRFLERSASPCELACWSSAEEIAVPFRHATDTGEVACSVVARGRDLVVQVDDDVVEIGNIDLESRSGRAAVNGRPVAFSYAVDDNTLFLGLEDRELRFINVLSLRKNASDVAGEGAVTAPMHGLVTELFVEEGQAVRNGDRIALVEAMKMQHEIRARVEGVVASLGTKAGSQVAGGDVIALIEPREESTS